MHVYMYMYLLGLGGVSKMSDCSLSLNTSSVCLGCDSTSEGWSNKKKKVSCNCVYHRTDTNSQGYT